MGLFGVTESGGGRAPREHVHLDKETVGAFLHADFMLSVSLLSNYLGRLPEASIIHRALVRTLKALLYIYFYPCFKM